MGLKDRRSEQGTALRRMWPVLKLQDEEAIYLEKGLDEKGTLTITTVRSSPSFLPSCSRELLGCSKPKKCLH